MAAAKYAMVETGLDAVKIAPLAAELGIARTSFYWFFKDRADLLFALLDDWEAKNTGAFVEACGAYAETIAEGLLHLTVVFYDEALFEPRLDFAIRGWAHRSDVVAARVQAADEARLDAIRALFARFGYEPDEADVRARTVYLTQIGYISMQVDEDMGVRIGRVAAYVKTFSGHAPTAREMDRFHARMGVAAPG